jgi:hypothetical protein
MASNGSGDASVHPKMVERFLTPGSEPWPPLMRNIGDDAEKDSFGATHKRRRSLDILGQGVWTAHER